MSLPVFGNTPQADAPTIRTGQPLQEDPVRGLTKGVNALFRHARSVIFSDLRDESLEGVHYDYSPWYCVPYDQSPNWQTRIYRLPYRPGSPLPGWDRGAKTTETDPHLVVWFRGRNINVSARMTRVSTINTDGSYTVGTTASADGFLAYGTGFSEDALILPFPNNCRSGDLFVIDFFWISRNDEESAEGWLSGVVIVEPIASGWPNGSTP